MSLLLAMKEQYPTSTTLGEKTLLGTVNQKYQR
jgi:hypothetical protein